MNTKKISTEQYGPSSATTSPSPNQAAGTRSTSLSQSQQGHANATVDSRTPSQQATRLHATALTSNRTASVPYIVQRIEAFGCPDVALFDSEIVGEICDRRLQNTPSWQSDYDADDYNKENQYVYRENVDPESPFYGFPHADSELGLYPSPAFSEDSMYPTSSNHASSLLSY